MVLTVYLFGHEVFTVSLDPRSDPGSGPESGVTSATVSASELSESWPDETGRYIGFGPR